MRIELSRTMTRRLKHSTPRISQRRSSALACTRCDRLIRRGYEPRFRNATVSEVSATATPERLGLSRKAGVAELFGIVGDFEITEFQGRLLTGDLC